MSGARTLLIMCSGLGLGNSTRLLGVVQALRAAPPASPEDLRIVVCTNGGAVPFWEAAAGAVRVELLRLESYGSSLGKRRDSIPWLSFLGPATAVTYLLNTWRIFFFLARNRTDLALIDSDYHCLPLLLFRIPILALGQAWDVIARSAEPSLPAIPRGELLIEKLDLLFQRLVCEQILVPCFEPGGRDEGKVRPVPLIVRREFEAPEGAQESGPMMVLLGGSGIGSTPLLAYARRHGLSVIGAPEGADSALDERARPLIDRAPAVLTQGGLSSLSECVARRKPMIVLPIEKHAEQLSNARTIQRLGLGLHAPDLTASPEELLRRLKEGSRGTASRWPRADGAGVVAGRLLRRLGLEAGPSPR